MINNKVFVVYRYYGKCVVDLEIFFVMRIKYLIVDFIWLYVGNYYVIYYKIVFYIWKIDVFKN